jgi:hypothetical protein
MKQNTSVFGDWLQQDSGCHHASAQLRLSFRPQAFTFHCSLLSSPCCLGLSSMAAAASLSFSSCIGR